MSLLLHCVYRRTADELQLGPQTLCVTSAGLGAVLSCNRQASEAVPSIEALRNYERAVEAAHLSHTVIPIRYGCRFGSETSVLRLLEEHRHEYDRLLDRLCGKTEMTIRLLFPPSPPTQVAPSAGTGKAYLDSLCRRFHGQQVFSEQETQAIAQWTGLLREWYVESKQELTAERQGRLVALYFLVERPSVERFRLVARSFSLVDGIKALLSGPWPPYNFVADSISYAEREGAMP